MAVSSELFPRAARSNPDDFLLARRRVRSLAEVMDVILPK
jgi:hypothetical protein